MIKMNKIEQLSLTYEIAGYNIVKVIKNYQNSFFATHWTNFPSDSSGVFDKRLDKCLSEMASG